LDKSRRCRSMRDLGPVSGTSTSRRTRGLRRCWVLTRQTRIKGLAGSGPCHFLPRSAQPLRSLSSLLLLCSAVSPLFASLLLCFQSLSVHRICLIAIPPDSRFAPLNPSIPPPKVFLFAPLAFDNYNTNPLFLLLSCEWQRRKAS